MSGHQKYSLNVCSGLGLAQALTTLLRSLIEYVFRDNYTWLKFFFVTNECNNGLCEILSQALET